MCMAIISKFSSLYFTFIFLYSFKMCIFSISEQKQEETTLLFCLIPTSRRTYIILRNYLHITALYLPILKRFLKIELICHCEPMCFMIDLVNICDKNSAVGAVFPPQYLNYSPQRLTNFLCQIFII